MSSSYVLDLGEVFTKFVKEREREWKHDRSTTIGASEVFDCLRQNWFKKRGAEFGYEPDIGGERWGATLRGTIMEDEFVEPALRIGMPSDLGVHMSGEDQVTLVTDKSSATPDMLVTGFPKGCSLVIKYGDNEIEIEDIKSDCIVFEIKSINSFAPLYNEKTKHKNQAIVQMGHIKENTHHDPYYAVVLYIDASWWDDITPFVVEYDEGVFEAAKARSADVFEADDPLNILPEGKMSGECEYCQWKTACGLTTLAGIPKADGLPDVPSELLGHFEAAIAKYKAAKEAEKEASYVAKEAQETLKELLMDLDEPKAKTDTWSVSWSEVKGRKTIDKQLLIDDGIDVRKYEKEGRPFDRLTITAK